jgi:hypothetical protein
MTSDAGDELDDFLSEVDEMIQEIDGVTAPKKIERVRRVQPQNDDFSDLEQGDPLKDHKNHGPPLPSMRQRRRLYPSGRIAGRQAK